MCFICGSCVSGVHAMRGCCMGEASFVPFGCSASHFLSFVLVVFLPAVLAQAVSKAVGGECYSAAQSKAGAVYEVAAV